RGEWERLPAPKSVPLRDVQVMAPIPPAALTLLKLQNRHASSPPTSPAGASGSPAPAPAPPDLGSVIQLRPALEFAPALERAGPGTIEVLAETGGVATYGRAVTVADLLQGDRVLLAKWIRRQIQWSGREATMPVWETKIVPLV